LGVDEVVLLAAASAASGGEGVARDADDVHTRDHTCTCGEVTVRERR